MSCKRFKECPKPYANAVCLSTPSVARASTLNSRSGLWPKKIKKPLL